MGNYPFLRQKICLMALIESVFARGAYDRTMSFQAISEETTTAARRGRASYHEGAEVAASFWPLCYHGMLTNWG
jgi:hypothetical protein